MSKSISNKTLNVKFRSKSIEKAEKINIIKVPSLDISMNTNSDLLILIRKNVAYWNPFISTERCMICWKPIEIYGKDARNFMECKNCHQKAHSDHMLRWLAKKDFCPYCQVKW